jgi:hypothetical protein
MQLARRPGRGARVEERAGQQQRRDRDDGERDRHDGPAQIRAIRGQVRQLD